MMRSLVHGVGSIRPLRLAAVAFACLALPTRSVLALPTPSRTAPSAVSQANAALSPRMAGAFVEWGARGRESNVEAWERSLGQPASSVPALDYFSQESWAAFRSMAWLPAFWLNANPKRQMIWSIPLTVKGTALSDVGEGLHDADFRVVADAIAAAHPRATIRLGWEMNLAGSLWLSKDREVEYIRAYRHVVALFRQASPGFTFDWCPGWGGQATPADRAYPGDDVVDTIGLDVYDFLVTPEIETRWVKDVLDAPFGLNWHRDFAARHGKLMSYPEWGVGQAGDNPYFVRKMLAWFEANRSRIAYAIYFNVDGAWPTRIDTGRFPKSQDTLKTLFAKP